ncbi:MAG: hypothetical protein IT215_09085 [Chitinophagaceae bacterium]|nr:MAG: G-D-S-L family lipolytic protein [Bacteroidetes bacterium OLB11]MCC6448821.1 hypothetical protein [Chitinophagaceae bacterium]
MKNKLLPFIILGICFSLSSCYPELKEKDIKAGSADFSRYVAVGNSLTSGYADGALYKEGQINSFPKMLSEQFELVGGGLFKIPYMESGGGNDGSNSPRRVLGYATSCMGETSLSPVFTTEKYTPLNNVKAAGPYNLVGVPGARAIDANLGLYSLLNPFLNRFCSTPGISSIISEATRINPTFFTFWLGNNDVLGYAMGGAVPPQNIFSASLSDENLFRSSIQTSLESLTKNGAKGAIANIPNVTSIPYFTTIPWNGVKLTQGKADTLNALYNQLGITNITWTEGNNGFVIVDSAAPNFIRKATANDLIILSTPSDSLKCGQWGVHPLKPLKDAYVLDENEVNEIVNHTAKLNAIISEYANTFDLALVDMNTFMKSLKSGMVYNGVSYSAVFVTGGGFSLDGVHPNPRGYAMIANEFIKSINQKYGAQIPMVNANKYKGVLFP